MNARIWIDVTSVQTVLFAFALGLVLARPGGAAPEPAPQASTTSSVANAPERQILPASTALTLPEARVIIEGATARARDIGRAAAIVVLDATGNTISVDRMDGASSTSEQMAAGKARIAVMLRQRSSEAARLLETNPPRYFGLLSLYHGQVYLNGGGVPLAVDGQLVGGVGVSGLGPGGLEEQAADAGVEAWERYRQTLVR